MNIKGDNKMIKSVNKEPEFWRLSLYERLYLVLTLAGFVAIVLTVRESQFTIHASYANQMTNWSIEIDKTFIEHPELRPYFYEGDTIMNDNPNYAKASAVAEEMLDVFDGIIGNRYYKLDPTDEKIWRNWMISCFSKSPILCQKYCETLGWYPKVSEVYELFTRTKH